MLASCTKTILSTWLWSIGWGWNHVLINTIMLMLLLVFVARLSIIRSVFLSLYFTGGGFVFLSAIALVWGVWWQGMAYSPEQWGPVLDALQITFYLALVYGVLQLGLCFFVRRFLNGRVPFLLLVSNLITAMIVYQLLPMNVL